MSNAAQPQTSVRPDNQPVLLYRGKHRVVKERAQASLAEARNEATDAGRVTDH
jgi:hypothetical protein